MIRDSRAPDYPSAERRAPSAERRAPSAERRAPSAERRAPSAERREAPPSAWQAMRRRDRAELQGTLGASARVTDRRGAAASTPATGTKPHRRHLPRSALVPARAPDPLLPAAKAREFLPRGRQEGSNPTDLAGCQPNRFASELPNFPASCSIHPCPRRSSPSTSVRTRAPSRSDRRRNAVRCVV